MPEHCLEYEALTMEERLLLNKEMLKWYETTKKCIAITDVWAAERSIIKKLRKEENDKRNREQNAGRRNN